MKRLLLIFCCAIATPAFAATWEDNWNSWFMYFGDHPIAKSKWGVHLEGQWRRADMGATWQQLLLRPGVNYQATKNLSFTFGYGFIETHPYGERPLIANTLEHRLFEQVLYSHKLKNRDLTHRFRLEQREIGVLGPSSSGTFATTDYRYENRVRYQIRTTFPLRLGDGKNYIAVANEIKFNFGKNVDRNVFDQNRAYVALGRDIGHQTRFEFGFLEQTVQRRGGQHFEHNHTLQIGITSRLPFGN